MVYGGDIVMEMMVATCKSKPLSTSVVHGGVEQVKTTYLEWWDRTKPGKLKLEFFFLN